MSEPTSRTGPTSTRGQDARPPRAPQDVARFVADLPKAELHVHLVGAASVPTVLELARRSPDAGVPTDEDALREFYRFTDFAHFIEVYIAVNSLVTTGEDVESLVVGLARDLAGQNVRYAEVTVTPYSHLLVGIAAQDVTAALEAGRRRAASEHGVELGYVFDIPGELGAEAGVRTARWVIDHAPSGTVAFGLGGPEIGFPRELFAEAFDMVRAHGLPTVPHAGETTGPESVWAALERLGASRVGHGINAVQDERLLAHLAERQVPLEVCPTSNLRTGAVADLAEHPFPRLREAGVPVSLASDDPGMFDTTLNREYELAHTVFGLSTGELADLARAAVEHSFAPEETRRRVLAEIDEVTGSGGAG
ncbi:adenosine deaminase [Thalassiella azotivora]